MNINQARQYFYQEINQPEQQINLAKAALYIAQEAYLDLEPERYLNILAQMAAEIQKRLPSQKYPLRIIKTINQYLYEDLGFIGNTRNYYDARNSFLNEVIDRRTGIPITLALVYLEIAERLGFPMVGIGMPGHFLIRPNFEDVGIYVDAFNSGEILFEQDCQERLAEIYQQPVELKPSFVEPVSKRRFLARMLMNLKLIYLNENDLPKALGVVERLLLLYPGAAPELRDRGLLYYQMGKWISACQDLETYLVQVPNADDADVIRQLVERMRQDV